MASIFRSLYQSFLQWIPEHRQSFFSGLGVFVVIVSVSIYIVINTQTVNKKAWELYHFSQNALQSGQKQQGLQWLNQVIQSYPRSPALPYAQLSKAFLFYENKQFSEANALAQQLLTKDPVMIRPQVLSLLATLEEDARKYPESMAYYQRILKEFPNNPVLPRVYLSIGRLHQLLKQPDSAKKVYENVMTQYPNSYWSEKAKVQYQKISPLPFEDLQKKSS